MPQKPYHVTFPDGYVQDFSGPEGMSDPEAVDRAIQERKVKEGTIQTTWFGGATKQASQEPGITTPLIGAAGTLAATVGAPAAVASGAAMMAPVAARWLKYASQKYFGDKPGGADPQMPTPSETALLTGEGVLAGGAAKAIGAAGQYFGKATQPQEIAPGVFRNWLKGGGTPSFFVRLLGERRSNQCGRSHHSRRGGRASARRHKNHHHQSP
jgi:hypothetical protein